MPYITQTARKLVEEGQPMQTAGELNYVFTMTIREYIKSKGASYQVFNDIIGALEGAKQEFYRRIVAPYEDQKIKQNGDVY